MEWLTSGMRRDLCVLLYGEERRAQQLKSALEAHYDRRVKPDRFYGALEALESTGHVEKRVSGLEDVYSLTDGGLTGVEAQYEWLQDHVGDRRPDADDVGTADGGTSDEGTVDEGEANDGTAEEGAADGDRPDDR